MLKNAKFAFLAVTMALALVVSPVSVDYAEAQVVTDQVISAQQNVAISASRDAIEEYTRLILYVIIYRLENELDT